MAIEFLQPDSVAAAKIIAKSIDGFTKQLERSTAIMSETVKKSTAEIKAELAEAAKSLDGLSGDVTRLTEALTILQASEALTDDDNTALAEAVDAAKAIRTRTAALDALTPDPTPPAPTE